MQPQLSPVKTLERLPIALIRLRLPIFACLAVATFAWHYPGTLDPDSTTQLHEALSGHLTDWHPPIMAALWRLLLNVKAGPAPLLALHVGLYWTGVWAICDATAREPKWRSLLPLLAALHPLALVMLGGIQKDVGLAASLIAAFGLLFRQRTLKRRVTPLMAIAIAALLAYAALVRWNGMLAVAPLLLYWFRPRRDRPLIVTAATAILFLAFIPVASFVDHGLLRASHTHPESSLEIFDLAGTAHFSSDDRLLDLRPGCYRPYFWDLLDSAPCGRVFQQLAGPDGTTLSDTTADALTKRWMKAIATHPMAYAEHRLAHFNSSTYFLVSPTARCASAPTYSGCDQPRARQIVDDFVKKNLLYWPCLWLAAGAWLVFRGRASAAVRALASSGILYGLGYLFVGVATDWRYHLWTTLAISMALALHFASDENAGERLKELILVVTPVAVAGYVARLLFLGL